jgi:DNA polymerase III alpha subunit
MDKKIVEKLNFREKIAKNYKNISNFSKKYKSGKDCNLKLDEVNDMDIFSTLGNEKKILGLYMLYNPLIDIFKYLKKFGVKKINEMTNEENEKVFGFVTKIKKHTAKNGDMMFLNLSDGESMLECVIFNNIYESIRFDICVDDFLIITGNIKNKSKKSFLVSSIEKKDINKMLKSFDNLEIELLYIKQSGYSFVKKSEKMSKTDFKDRIIKFAIHCGCNFSVWYKKNNNIYQFDVLISEISSDDNFPFKYNITKTNIKDINIIPTLYYVEEVFCV